MLPLLGVPLITASTHSLAEQVKLLAPKRETHAPRTHHACIFTSPSVLPSEYCGAWQSKMQNTLRSAVQIKQGEEDTRTPCKIGKHINVGM